MKSLKLLIFAGSFTFWTGQLLSQTKMILTLDGKESDLFGYSLDPSSGSSKEITMFGPMQNAGQDLQFDFVSGKLVPAVDITITDAVTGTSAITLKNVTVLSVKQFISSYSNGGFTVSPGGNVNTEVKCKYEKIEISNSAATNSGKPGNVNTLAKKDDGKWVISNAA